MTRKKILSLIGLGSFAMMQISACFVAGQHTSGFVSVFYYILGGISCLFGLALNFLLLVIGVDVFGAVYGSFAADIGKKQDDDEDEDGDEIEEVPN
jgi:hypothetical protein